MVWLAFEAAGLDYAWIYARGSGLLSINHIAAVVIPAVFGFVWLVSPPAVFLAGAAIAALSLLCAQLMPHLPAPGRETTLSAAAAAEAE